MSLEISLMGETAEADCTCPCCDNTHKTKHRNELFSANITHNLNKMANAAGFYKHLWRPEEVGITQAKELIQPLADGIALMRSDRARFEAFNASNGWGTYEQFLPWLENLLNACKEYPEATIEVSR